MTKKTQLRDCEYCGGKTRTERVRMHHYRKGRLYVLEGVEAEVCEECGERYYRARILDAINEFLDASHSVKEVISVEVVDIPDGLTKRVNAEIRQIETSRMTTHEKAMTGM